VKKDGSHNSHELILQNYFFETKVLTCKPATNGTDIISSNQA